MSWQLLGGAMVGTTIGWTVLWLRDRAGPALIEIAVSIATSDLGAMEARNLSLSLAVVVIGCGTGGLRRLSGPKDGRGAFLGRNANQRHGLLGRDKLARLIGVVLLGWSCPSRGAGWAWRLAILAGSDNGDRGPRSGAGRPMEWLSVVSTRLPPLRESLAGEGAAGQVAAAGVVAWASTRSVIRLIVVLSVPASWPDGQPFAERGLLLIVTAAVILGSVLLQGLTLRRAVHGADFSGSG